MLFFFDANRANGQKLRSSFHEAVAGLLDERPVSLDHPGVPAKIVDAPASDAANVLVAARVAVEALDRAAELELSNYTLFREIIQVSIDGAEADPRDAPANSRVELIRRRMAVKPHQLLEDNGSLLCIPHTNLRSSRT